MYMCKIVHNYIIAINIGFIQSLLKSAGKDGKKTVFLITDTQIKDEKFLEDVDGLLNAGEVPNLFPIDEKQEIIEVCYIHVTSQLLC